MSEEDRTLAQAVKGLFVILGLVVLYLIAWGMVAIALNLDFSTI